uniref:Uncharacterized protein n=1 Tax=Cucumis melo TaxID=3656 RepID=A0A9I9EAB3_CUCME
GSQSQTKKRGRGIGTAIRYTIPLSCENWKVVPVGVRELVIDRLQTHFEFDPPYTIVRKYLEEMMQNTFREFRANLQKYYCESDDRKKRETNKRSRSTVKFNHVTRAKSFLQVRLELKKKKGCDVNEIEDSMKHTFMKKKDGSMIRQKMHM